jgi:LDH2 family malate/lactate/ureidoglycolate dehydrogenase
VGMIDLFVEICGSAPFARAHGARNDRCLFEMSLSICAEGQALVRERERGERIPFCFSQKVQ